MAQPQGWETSLELGKVCASGQQMAATPTSKDMSQLYFSKPNFRGTVCGKAARTGLWGSGEVTNRSTRKQILFSKYGNLFETITALIDKSLSGYTSRELSIIIMVKADDALHVMWLKERVRRQKTGGSHVYYSIREDLFKHQLSAREQQMPAAIETLALPDYQRLIAVLVEIILQDSVVAEKLQKGIAQRNFQISIAEIKAVIEHYQLKKKRNKS